jgi:hypothetical protein
MFGMKVFISSGATGYERFRAAVREAIESRGHTEAPTHESADLVILLIGTEYGAFGMSGLSAPHEEFRTAKELRPVLVFVQSGVHRAATQQAFLEEATAWATGPAHGSYADPDELRALVVRSIYRYALALSASPMESLLERARGMLESRYHGTEGPVLLLAIAGGPYQEIVEPAEFEGRELPRDVQREAMFGKYPVFEERAATSVGVRGGELVLSQLAAAVAFSRAGDIRVAQSVRGGPNRRGNLEIEALIEEDIAAGLVHLMHFADWLLDRLDPLRGLTDLVVVAGISQAGTMPWRTRAEQSANPRQGSMGSGSDGAIAILSPPHRHRQALTDDTERLAHDLVLLLRRQFRTLDVPAAVDRVPERVSLRQRVLGWVRRRGGR